MSRRAYSITASMTLFACRRLAAVATSRAPSPISDVKMVAYSRSNEFSDNRSSVSFCTIHSCPRCRFITSKPGGLSPLKNSIARSRRCQLPSR